MTTRPHEATLLGDILRAAGDAALRFGGTPRRSWKSDGSPVTEADRAAEEVIVGALEASWPGCAIRGEEGARVEGTDGTWYVDPIDGTSAFIEGLPTWGPTVALERDGRFVLGALWLPRVGELWFAAEGQGAWRDDERLEPPPLEVVGRSDSLYLPSRFHTRMPVPWPGKVRALGASALHLAYAASGGAAATVIAAWAPWDVGCGILLVREAGREVADLTGAPVDPMTRPGRPFLAGAPAALQLISRATRPG